MEKNTQNLESKYITRNNALFSNETFSETKEDLMNKELSLGKSFQERLFLRKRMSKKLTKKNSENSPSKIEDNLTISLELYNKCKESTVSIENINQIIKLFNSSDFNKKYVGLVGLRKLLCHEKYINEIVSNYNLLSRIITLLDDNYPVEFKYEALWCLINISYVGEKESEKIKNKGGVNKVINLLKHNLDEIKIMSLWCLNNMVTDSLVIKKFLAKNKLINSLIVILTTNNNQKIIYYCVSIIKELIKLNLKEVKKTLDVNNLINIISKIIMENEFIPENNIIKYIYHDCLCILSYISEVFKKYRDTLLENGIISYLIELVKKPIFVEDQHLFLIFLKIIGNLFCGNSNQAKQTLNYDILSILKKYITSNNLSIQKEVCWIISNISADTEESIIKLIDNGFYPLLMQILDKCEKCIRIEILFTLGNFTLLKNKTYLENLINNGLLKVFGDGLKGEELKEIIICLESLQNLLTFGLKYNVNGRNIIADEIEKMGIGDVLEKLQFHRNDIIYEKALYIIENFFKYEYA